MSQSHPVETSDELVIRPVMASDAEWLRRTVDRVSQPSRLIHMPETASRIRTGLLSWMTQVDGVNHVALASIHR